ncbi:hypothetical protein VM98_38090, partial [Streptomyces rubellomurinus subsp. indigoferus]
FPGSAVAADSARLPREPAAAVQGVNTEHNMPGPPTAKMEVAQKAATKQLLAKRRYDAVQGPLPQRDTVPRDTQDHLHEKSLSCELRAGHLGVDDVHDQGKQHKF